MEDGKKNSVYEEKRDFRNTPEPRDATRSNRSRQERPLFVVQRHDASTLHFDFRLEAYGVLKSWAVPKGPPRRAGTRRLAIMVEDHPLSYAKFEGTIPEGNYGAGEVTIWDRGWYSAEGAPGPAGRIKTALRKGELKFTLHGRKLRGRYILTKFRRENGNQWLLIKLKEKTT